MTAGPGAGQRGALASVLRPRHRRSGRGDGADGDPFRILGLEPRGEVTDEEVHAAWRRIASATHPDRADGGDPRRFADAAAAYTLLRTRFSRGEVLADLGAAAAPMTSSGGSRRVMDVSSGRRLAAAGPIVRRAREGRPVRLTLRILVALLIAAAAVLAAGPHPASPALVTGVATWLVLTARRDLAPPGRRGGED